MAIIGKGYDLDALKASGDYKHAPLWWHLKGLSYTRDGYGKKIPTEHMVRLPGSNKWRRVYVAIFSNAGTAYVLEGKDWIVIR